MENNQTSIMVGLHIDELVIDLKIPIQVSVKRLKELLQEVLPVLQVYGNNFEIHVLNKPIVLNDSMLLSMYPLSNGDQLKIIGNEEL